MPVFVVGILIGYFTLKMLGSQGLNALLGSIQGTLGGLVLWSMLVLVSPSTFFHVTHLGFALLAGSVLGCYSAASE